MKKVKIMSIKFSTHPGVRERHLQRQYKNPLFPPEQQNFDEQRLSGARYMDEQEQNEFSTDYMQLVAEVTELKPNEGSEKMLDLKSRLDQLYEQCSGLAGDNESEKQAITQLVGIIMNAIWKSASGDAEAEANLRQEELARNTHYQLLQFPLVVDLLRPKSPITEKDLLPSLLSESEEALSAAFYLFDEDQQTLLCAQAVELLDKKLLENIDIPQASKQLEVMQNLLQNSMS